MKVSPLELPLSVQHVAEEPSLLTACKEDTRLTAAVGVLASLLSCYIGCCFLPWLSLEISKVLYETLLIYSCLVLMIG